MPRTRLLSVDDVPALTRLLVTNREHLAPWEPVRTDEWFTEANQRAIAERVLAQHDADQAVPLAIVDDEGSLAGRLTLSGIVRGALQSAAVGYWVDQARGGRGLATSAVEEAKTLAFDDLGLHRLQAETLLDNPASRRVLDRTGFQLYGRAPHYLKIAGRWQDCLMFQVLTPYDS